MNPLQSKSSVPQPDVRYELPPWSQFVWLIYLGFLFTPLLARGHDWRWLWPTLATIPVAVTLYVRTILKFRKLDQTGDRAIPEVVAMALIGYALAPLNDSANTYIVYCVAVAPFAISSLRRLLVFAALVLGAYALEQLLLGFQPVLFGITFLVTLASGASNYMMLENRRKNMALRIASEELHRLARVADRERIGRDLHDLLGHTLSLIAIKSELAAKLLDRDSVAATREVVDVMNIAREALKQVRTAVSGIRAAALEGEVASARALLEAAGVAVTYERDGTVLPAEVETALAMIVREAVTNIQRHAGARHAWIEVMLDEYEERGSHGMDGGTATGAERHVLLRVCDDGRGGITAHGNGLGGIWERVRSLGGTLELNSPRGEGTVLRVRIPLAPPVGFVSSTGPVSMAESVAMVGSAALAGPAAVVGPGAAAGAAALSAKAMGSGGIESEVSPSPSLVRT